MWYHGPVENMTTKQAAERLGIAQAYVRQLLLKGTLKGARWGRDWMIPSREVERYASLRERGELNKGGWPKGKSRAPPA